MNARRETGGFAGARPTAAIRARVIVVSLLVLLAPQAARGQEEAELFSRVLYVNVFLGANWPVNSMNVLFDPNFLAGGRGEYAFTPLIRAGAQLSFHSFDSERPGEADNEGAVLMSIFVKALGRWGPYHPFGLLGVGAYVTKERETSARRWDGGAQVGVGLEYPMSEHFSANTGLGFHMVLRGGDEDDYFWLEGYLGFLFRQP